MGCWWFITLSTLSRGLAEILVDGLLMVHYVEHPGQGSAIEGSNSLSLRWSYRLLVSTECLWVLHALEPERLSTQPEQPYLREAWAVWALNITLSTQPAWAQQFISLSSLSRFVRTASLSSLSAEYYLEHAVWTILCAEQSGRFAEQSERWILPWACSLSKLDNSSFP